MDTFVDSSWYFLRYVDAKNDKQVFDKQLAEKWMNVDIYIGGIEHAILHLLYARFINKFFHQIGYTSQKEPFEKLLTQGLVLAEAYKDTGTNKYFKPEAVEKKGNEIRVKSTGKQIEGVMEKMSKSKYNGVDPERFIKEFGPDVLRLYVLFKAPYDKDLEWDQQQVAGQQRFLQRLENMVKDVASKQTIKQETSHEEKQLVIQMNQFVASVTDGLVVHHSFNTCVSDLHKCALMLQGVSDQVKQSEYYAQAVKDLIVLMTPITPGFSSRMWKVLVPSDTKDVYAQPYPTARTVPQVSDSSTLIQLQKVVIQIKGKTKHVIELPVATCQQQDAMTQAVKENAKVQQLLQGKTITNVIIANQGKIINFVHD